MTKAQHVESNIVDLAAAAAQDRADDMQQSSAVKRVITLSAMSFIEKQLRAEALDKEAKIADSMGLNIEINGITMKPALIDQGASRSVMRHSAFKHFIKQHGPGAPKFEKVDNMYVVGSTNEHLPVIGRVFVRIATNGTHIGSSFIYIVKDTKTKDIICDLVIGRATLGASRYTRLDMSGNGALVSIHPDYINTCHEVIKCSKCTFANDSEGKRQLVLTASDTPEPSVATNSFTHKLMRINALVMQRDLNSEAKEQLRSHLINNFDHFDFPSSPAPISTSVKDEKDEEYDHEDEFINSDDNIYSSSEAVHFTHLASELDKTAKGSAEEAIVINEMLTTFVPRNIEKPTHRRQRESESSERVKSSAASSITSNEDDVEEIEFPFAPPTLKDDTPEYHASKRLIIAQMVQENANLTSAEKDKLTATLIKFADRFSVKGENMERTSSVEHEIDTGGTKPFREKLRQYSPAIQDIIAKEVALMIKQGVIVPSKSAYASNLLLVRKADPSSEGGVKNRVCASYVRLNFLTEKDSYPLPNIQYIFDKIGKSVYFTTMDLLSGFWQIMIKPEHRHKTAFITMRGLYEFVVMPFGLCNAPATFQRLMDHVIEPEWRDFIETYIDDLMTHSSTFDDHVNHLDILLTALRKHKLVVKLSKCKFAQKEVKFLGHVITHNQIKTNPEAVEAIKRWQRPSGGGKQAVTAVRGFLGMAGWYRKFIRNFADIAKPLVHLTKKDVVWEWTDECQSSFEKLRDALTSQPVLAVADANKSYIVHTDASEHAMGAILQQEDDEGHLHPIAYASKTFNDAQKNYDTTEREALAIPWSLQHFNTYCEGHKYTLFTDHKALSYIKTNANNTKRIARWQLMLQNYNIDKYNYIKGEDNHAADLLSRPLMEVKDDEKKSSQVMLNAVTTRKKLSVSDTIVQQQQVPGAGIMHKNKSAKAAKRRRSRTTKTEDFVVEAIIDKRVNPDKADETQYLVRWQGYSPAEDTWLSVDRAANASELIIEYERQAAELAAATRAGGVDHSFIHHDFMCDKCKQNFHDAPTLFMHRWREHKVTVPTNMLEQLRH